MSLSVPASYVRYHGPNIYGMFANGLRSALPLPRRVAPPTPSAWREQQLAPVPEVLVDAYAAWTGAPAERYAEVLPPHLFSFWAMPMIAELTAMAPYNLLSVLNQGCRLRIEHAMPRGESIHLRGRLAEISDEPRRIRIATELEAGCDSVPLAQRMDVAAAVPKASAAKAEAERPEEPAFETIGTWSASAQDGLNFALLTGDFNPIHTLWPLARRTRYGGCILHGFGFLSRSYEAIQNTGLRIVDFDARYVRPLRLPATNLAVQIGKEAATDGRRALRLQSPDGQIHLVGQFLAESA